MLAHSSFEALPLWPAAFWTLIFTSCLLAIKRKCQISAETYGCSPLDSNRKPDAAVLYLFFPLAAMFEVAVHAYLLFVIGFTYLLLAMPVYVLGGVLLPWLLDHVPTTQYVLPVVYLGFAAAFLVLLGFVDIELLRSLNSELYTLLTGLPLRT